MNFTLNDRASAGKQPYESNVNEYNERESDNLKFLKMIKHLFQAIVTLSTRESSVEFFITMDHYFTIERVMLLLRNYGIGTVGTARARRGWSPPCLTVLNDELFNTFFYIGYSKNN